MAYNNSQGRNYRVSGQLRNYNGSRSSQINQPYVPKSYLSASDAQKELLTGQGITNLAIDSSNFGSGRGENIGLAAQLATAGVGAYTQYKAKKTLAEQELASQDAFATQFPQYADLVGQLSPETRQAYTMEAMKQDLSANDPMTQLKVSGERLNQQKTQAEINKLNKETSSEGGRGKPPQGYDWNSDGTLLAIPGGPAEKQTAESAGKTALVTQGKRDIGRFKDSIIIKNEDGSIGYDRGKLAKMSLYGSPGARLEDSLLFNAINSRLRLESGSAVPESEVKRSMKAFAPGPLDSDETIASKIERMDEFFSLAEDEIGKGRGAATNSNPQAAQNPQPHPQKDQALAILKARGKI